MIDLKWKICIEEPMLVKTFLRQQGISKRLLVQIKQDGYMKQNGKPCIAIDWLQNEDFLEIGIPSEGEHETTLSSEIPIEILFEDDFFLVVNKPYGVASIPSRLHPDLSMANRVKGYYKRQGYENCIPHVVTRLDRDTSGVMLFAKHRLSHAWMDQQLRMKQLKKTYQAILTGTILKESHGWLDFPIGRCEDSIITRCVDSAGKPSLTEYFLEKSFQNSQLVKIQLHTGRTHQIRVHFTHIGAPLMGDDLYGGEVNDMLSRQALHCASIEFIHPLTKVLHHIQAPLPKDMNDWIHLEQ